MVGFCAPPRGVGLFLVLPVLGLLVFSSFLKAREEHPAAELDSAHVVFESGDIVFRRGTGLLSQAVLSADVDSTFSHTGIVYLIDGVPFVVHASPGESLAHPSKLKVDSMAEFLEPASAAAVYRARTDSEALGRRAAERAYAYALEGRLFDTQLDLGTDEALYCTELVWKSYLAAGLDLVDGELDRLAGPLFHKSCLLPSRLQASPHIRQIETFSRRTQ